MKTIVRNGTNVSLYLFDDDKSVVITDTDTKIGKPTEIVVCDCTSANSTLILNVPNVDGWVGGKYTFNGTTWALNPEYVEPSAE